MALVLLGACSATEDATENDPPSGGPRTSTMVLIGSDAVLAITDLGDRGPTPGDVRTLSLTLTSADRATTGRAEIVQTLTHQADGVGTAVKTLVINLPDGSLMAMGTTEFSDFVSDTGRPSDTTEKIAIIGGQGAYLGASGEIDIVVLPRFQSSWAVRVTLA